MMVCERTAFIQIEHVPVMTMHLPHSRARLRFGPWLQWSQSLTWKGRSTMFAKTTKTLIAALVLASTSLTLVASTDAAPERARSRAEQANVISV